MISFPPEVQPEMLTAPLLYGVIVVPFSALWAWMFRRRDAREVAASSSAP